MLVLPSGDIEAAIAFITEQRGRKDELKRRRKRDQDLRLERKAYGKTASGSYVEMECLERLSSVGCDR